MPNAKLVLCSLLIGALPCPSLSGQGSLLRMLDSMDLSPNGRSLVFSRGGKLWRCPSEGGMATQLLADARNDRSPRYSPDGKRIAFLSDRSPDGTRIWLVDADGGSPELFSRSSVPTGIEGWSRDGKFLYVRMAAGRSPWDDYRVFRMPVGPKGKAAIDVAPELLLPAAGSQVSESPDGKRLLFIRRGRSSARRGYAGPAAGQLWMAELGGQAPRFTRLSPERPDVMNQSYSLPRWVNNDTILYRAERGAVRDLFLRDLSTGTERRVTGYGVDAAVGAEGVFSPVLSANGKILVYRYAFDYYRLEVSSGAAARKIEIRSEIDPELVAIEHKRLKRTQDLSFTQDGKEICFAADGDVYVMDRILREPVRITSSPEQERELLFSKDGKRIYFISDMEGGNPDLWCAERKNAKEPWFLQKGFQVTRLTNNAASEYLLSLSPDGKQLAYFRDGDLYARDCKEGKERRILEGWGYSSYDWSPDARHIVIAQSDASYNSDIWIVPTDKGPGKETRPINLSRHPDNDYGPVWSPDGKRIAWTGRREDGEVDVFYVNLFPKAEEATSRDRKLEKAKAAFKKKSKSKAAKKKTTASKKASSQPSKGKAKEALPKTGGPSAKKNKKPKGPAFDPKGLFDRVHRIRIRDSRESRLSWSRDGKKLYFRATVSGKSGYYAVQFPDKLKPQLKIASPVSAGRWLSTGELAGHSGGTPAVVKDGGSPKKFSFDIESVVDWRKRRVVVLREVWRNLRDRFYDERLNHLDWEAIYRRYAKAAPDCLDSGAFGRLVNEMIGHLNASHMGYYGAGSPKTLPSAPSVAWRTQSYDLGCDFTRDRTAPGLLVSRVLRGSPASKARSRIQVGERVVAVAGKAVQWDSDLASILRLPKPREVEVTVLGKDKKERKVRIWPMPVTARRSLLYDDWVERTRAKVEKASDGRLGYLHIRGMNRSSFNKLEADLYAAGAGKDGLLIDVRNNGGGSTADHVLTVLCQPSHAITLSRGGKVPGYPQDRRVYAVWEKPIVLLCNERSFSNAEILSHAIQSLKRGLVVGERTAGGVISTGGTGLMDGSFMRLPGRAWFVKTTGEDMELNGCMPDIRVPQGPEDEMLGRDPQLSRAIEACLDSVKKEKQRPAPKLRWRSMRK